MSDVESLTVVQDDGGIPVKALMLLGLLGDPVTVSVDAVAGADAPARSGQLARGVAERLEEEGFALGTPADVRVFIDARNDRVAVRLFGKVEDAFRVNGGPAAVLELEVVHHILAALESVRPDGSDQTSGPRSTAGERPDRLAPSDPEVPPGFRSPSVRATARPQRPLLENALRLSAHAGVYGRPRVVDPVVGFGIRLGKASGVNVGGTLEVMASDAPGVRVLETHPGLALGARVGRGRVAFHGDAILGLLVHDAWIDGRGHRRGVDFAATVPLGVSVWVTRGLDVDVSLRGGYAMRPRSHVVGGERVWSRGVWRLGASLGFTYGWGLG